jgi:hypothetical protein
MGLLRPKYAPREMRSRRARPRPRLVWQDPTKGKTTLSVTRQGSLWPNLSLVDTCREKEPEKPTNTAAIALLESWIKMPTIENDFSGSIRYRLDENRLSDRKFYS